MIKKAWHLANCALLGMRALAGDAAAQANRVEPEFIIEPACSERVAIPDCAVVAGVVLMAEQSSHLKESPAYIPEFAQYPAGKTYAGKTYAGKTRMPDFSGRDRAFREFRTKIREGLAAQRRFNFAGRYNAVHIGLTGGFVLAVVESATGRVIWSDALGGGPYYEYDFKRNSRLLVM